MGRTCSSGLGVAKGSACILGDCPRTSPCGLVVCFLIDFFFFLKGEISIFAIWSKFARLKAKLTPRAQEIFFQSGKLDLRIYESVDGGIDTPNFFQCQENIIFAIWSKFARLRAQLSPRAQKIFSSQENRIYASTNQLMVVLTPKIFQVKRV